jgi:hypothetical protein
LKNRTITSLASAGGAASRLWNSMLSPGPSRLRLGSAVQV